MLDQVELVQIEEVYLDPELVVNIQARLSRIEGQVRGIKRMLNEKEECEKILIQMSSIKSALNQVPIKLLEGHMDTCVAACILAGDTEALDQLKNALSLVLRKA